MMWSSCHVGAETRAEWRWCAQDAVGDRVSIELKDGQQLRVQLPFAPAHPLPKAVLDALAVVLPPASWHVIFSCQLAAPGRACHSSSMPAAALTSHACSGRPCVNRSHRSSAQLDLVRWSLSLSPLSNITPTARYAAMACVI